MKNDFDDWDDKPTRHKIKPEHAMFDEGGDDDGVKPENVNGWPDESISALERLNDKYCAVYSKGNYRIMFHEKQEVGLSWSTSSVRDFEHYYANINIERDMEGLSRNAQTKIPLGEAWQKWPSRKTATGTCFDTKSEPAALVNGALNLWSGFSVVPAEGEWNLFEDMIRNDLCAENGKLFDYVMKWIAWKFQNPGLIPGVALAFKGAKGTGKTTLGETIANIFGAHGMATGNLDEIIGRFNGHIETKCFIYGDEITWGGDVKREAAVKKIITDLRADYELKTLTPFQGVNHVGLMVAGNDKWIAPASMDERRWCVATVADTHQVKLGASKSDPKRRYWDAVQAQVKSIAGRAAFLHAMLHKDVEDWNPVYDVPATEALGEQKFEGFKGINRWWFERLRDCDLPIESIIGDATAADSDWRKGAMYVRPSACVTAFAQWTERMNAHTNVSPKAMLAELRAWGVTGGSKDDGGKPMKHRGERFWKLPKLSDARRTMAQKIGYNPFA